MNFIKFEKRQNPLLERTEISVIFMGDKSDEMVQNLKMELDS